jgi:hypothetical protein
MFQNVHALISLSIKSKQAPATYVGKELGWNNMFEKRKLLEL